VDKWDSDKATLTVELTNEQKSMWGSLVPWLAAVGGEPSSQPPDMGLNDLMMEKFINTAAKALIADGQNAYHEVRPGSNCSGLAPYMASPIQYPGALASAQLAFSSNGTVGQGNSWDMSTFNMSGQPPGTVNILSLAEKNWCPPTLLSPKEEQNISLTTAGGLYFVKDLSTGDSRWQMGAKADVHYSLFEERSWKVNYTGSAGVVMGPALVMAGGQTYNQAFDSSSATTVTGQQNINATVALSPDSAITFDAMCAVQWSSKNDTSRQVFMVTVGYTCTWDHAVKKIKQLCGAE
jgi:hypothetical protein